MTRFQVFHKHIISQKLAIWSKISLVNYVNNAVRVIFLFISFYETTFFFLWKYMPDITMTSMVQTLQQIIVLTIMCSKHILQANVTIKLRKKSHYSHHFYTCHFRNASLPAIFHFSVSDNQYIYCADFFWSEEREDHVWRGNIAVQKRK